MARLEGRERSDGVSRFAKLTIVVLVAAVLIADLVIANGGVISWVLTGLEVIGGALWTIAVLGKPFAEPSAGPISVAVSSQKSSGQRFRAVLASLVFVLLLATSFLLKVLLLTSTQYKAVELNELYRTYVAMSAFIAVLGWFGRGQRTLWFFGQVAEHPSRMLAMSLFVVALFGAFLLATPFALSDPTKGSFVDAFFDSTGALCGALAVSDVGRQYQFFGQAVILALMQIGGFGIMVLSASIAILAGRNMEVRSTARYAEVVDADSLSDVRRTVFRIVLWTIAIEAVGAVLLYVQFAGLPGIDAHPTDAAPLAGGGGALWSAVFHSVSAFCNAGFSLYRGNLAPFVADFGVNAVICTLIILGGLGFPVLSELTRRAIDFVARRPRRRLSLHAQVVLVMSGILIVAGAVPILLLEWSKSFSSLPTSGKVLASLFQSVTARTAGFSSVDLAAMGAPALLVMIALMFIGAGPGSTGGGIKVTTFAVLFATFRAERASAPAPTLFGREVPQSVQRKAIVVTFLSLTLVALMAFLILVFEDQPPLFVFYETTSAFGSVGCSTGIETKMGPIGKLLLTLTMMIGRIGPLTFALAAAGKVRSVTYRLPEERVMIG
jgi:trk system potassium uptake protein